jgi:rsbT antagonist protein RsbS
VDVGHEAAQIPIQLARGVLIASVQVDLDDGVMAGFKKDLLERIRASGASGVILDLSGLDTLDSYEFAELRRLIVMSRVMGARAVLVGLKAGIVASLVMTGVDVDGLEAAPDLDEAFRLLEPALEAPEQAPPDDEPEPSQEAEDERAQGTGGES